MHAYTCRWWWLTLIKIKDPGAQTCVYTCMVEKGQHLIMLVIFTAIGLPGADAIMPNSIMHAYTGKGQQTASSHN